MEIVGDTFNSDSFASATVSVAVTPNDSTVLNFNALYVGTGGDVIIKHLTNGAAITYVGVPSGSILPVAGVRVMAATGASDIVAMKW